MPSIASVSSTRAIDVVGVEAHVERTECDLLADGRREHLRVGVLEDEPDPAAKATRELLVLEVVLGDLFTEGRVGAAVGEQQPVEELQQRRLAAAVGAEQRDLLAAVDLQRHAVERRDSGRGSVVDIGARERARCRCAHAMTRSPHEHERRDDETARSTDDRVASTEPRRRERAHVAACTHAGPSPCRPLPTSRAPCRTARPPTPRRSAGRWRRRVSLRRPCARGERCTCRRPRSAGGTGSGTPSTARGRTSWARTAIAARRAAATTAS